MGGQERVIAPSLFTQGQLIDNFCQHLTVHVGLRYPIYHLKISYISVLYVLEL